MEAIRRWSAKVQKKLAMVVANQLWKRSENKARDGERKRTRNEKDERNRKKEQKKGKSKRRRALVHEWLPSRSGRAQDDEQKESWERNESR